LAGKLEKVVASWKKSGTFFRLRRYALFWMTVPSSKWKELWK
jgi:hypothetical protein